MKKLLVFSLIAMLAFAGVAYATSYYNWGNTDLNPLLAYAFDTVNGHSHDGTNSRQVTTTGPVAALTSGTIAGITALAVVNVTTTSARMTFKEGSGGGSNLVTLAAPASTGDVTVTLPDATGTLSQIDVAETLSAVKTFTADPIIGGTTPLLTIGDGGDEDAGIQINSDTTDYYIASENSADTLIIGTGSAIGTTPAITITGQAVGLASTLGMVDDAIATLGTTTSTAATKVTLEQDATTTGVGQFHVGTSAVQQELITDPGATVMPMTLNVNKDDAGNMNDYVGFYNKITITGVGDSGSTVIADGPRAYVGLDGNNAVVGQIYASQPWAKHDGTGAITAMSALSALVDTETGNFTASTVNAGHFHIEGSGIVTGQFDGVMIEAYPDVNGMDSGLAIVADSGAEMASGIRIAGAPTCDITFSGTQKVYSGTAVNNAAVFAQVGTGIANGSLYLSTSGKVYIKIANAGAEGDWAFVNTTDD